MIKARAGQARVGPGLGARAGGLWGRGRACRSEQSCTPLATRVSGERSDVLWRRKWRHAARCCGKACAPRAGGGGGGRVEALAGVVEAVAEMEAMAAGSGGPARRRARRAPRCAARRQASAGRCPSGGSSPARGGARARKLSPWGREGRRGCPGGLEEALQEDKREAAYPVQVVLLCAQRRERAPLPHAQRWRGHPRYRRRPAGTQEARQSA